MSYQVITGTLAADVATNGTVAFSYPTGFSKGSFELAGPTELYVNGSPYKEPHDFTTSYGASSVTVTYTGTTTLKAGSRFTFGFRRSGVSGNRPFNAIANSLKAALSPLWLINLGSPTLAASNNVALSQSVTGAGTAFVLNGTLLQGAVAILDVPRNVVAAWTGTAVLTITGKDEFGITMIEKSASGTSHTGKKAFKQITSITTSASITSATVGTGVQFGLPCVVTDRAQIYGEFESGANIAPPPRFYISGQINQTDLLAPTVQDIVCPVNGFIASLRTTVQVAITTGGTIVPKVNTVAVTGMTITIANADAKGTRKSTTPTTARSSTTVVAAGDAISLTPASFATAGAVNWTLEIETTRVQGTFTLADKAANTATSGDVRGTYSPLTAADGSISYELLVSLPNPEQNAPSQWVS